MNRTINTNQLIRLLGDGGFPNLTIENISTIPGFEISCPFIVRRDEKIAVLQTTAITIAQKCYTDNSVKGDFQYLLFQDFERLLNQNYGNIFETWKNCGYLAIVGLGLEQFQKSGAAYAKFLSLLILRNVEKKLTYIGVYHSLRGAMADIAKSLETEFSEDKTIRMLQAFSEILGNC